MCSAGSSAKAAQEYDSALSDAMAWELSRLSHQLRRMQSRGLVHRSPSAADGRGVEYGITPTGSMRSAPPTASPAVRVKRAGRRLSMPR